MLGKRSRPTTIKKPGVATRPAGIVECATSPRSPLDYRILSPRSPKNYDQQGGVGLGIVVALNDNTNNFYGGEILAKYALNGRFSSRSNPIPMNNSSTINYNKSECEDHEGLDDMLDEEFTYVTCHVPNKPKTTRVYYNGVAHGHVNPNPSGINRNLGVFTISSPATSFDYANSYSDFLSSCHLCKITLHGKDIYMYRGEKAFCSEECRQSQICKEERKEQRKSEASRTTNVSSSPCSYTARGGHIFSPGIMAL